ncbi:DUF1801 domain-containing protein [Mucilaginibacter myungsuensis]|uniref:DUF1801 domain-containing protein n=1 Tax=Mucilaginibacter myungsuensis TaxID=649104 RepID=A0A929KV44_9SPHI|nr:DUF1801 domain-containing protein [Mucilaginibacter myungsuensis]
MQPIDQYFARQDEPARSCLLFLRSYILKQDTYLTESLKYGMPFYSYRGKMCCYLWGEKKTRHPYIGIVEGKAMDHPLLVQDKRARMKVLPIDPNQDMPLALLDEVLQR